MNKNKKRTLHTHDLLKLALKQYLAQLIKTAIDVELEAFIEQYEHLKKDGKQAVVRNGYLPERPVQTSLGTIFIKIPKIRDRTQLGIKFNSNIVPPYRKSLYLYHSALQDIFLYSISNQSFYRIYQLLFSHLTHHLPVEFWNKLEPVWKAIFSTGLHKNFHRSHFPIIWTATVNKRQSFHTGQYLIMLGLASLKDAQIIAVKETSHNDESGWKQIFKKINQRKMQYHPQYFINMAQAKLTQMAYQKWPNVNCEKHMSLSISNLAFIA